MFATELGDTVVKIVTKIKNNNPEMINEGTLLFRVVVVTKSFKVKLEPDF